MTTSNISASPRGNRLKWIAINLMIYAIAGAVYWWTRPESPARQFRSGLDALAAADFERAATMSKLLAERPGHEPHSHLLQGANLLRRGKPRESLDELKQALDNDETRVRAQVLAGEALAKLKQSLQAAEVLRQALASEPDNVDAHRWAGVAYYDLGAMEPAVHHLERLASLAQDDPRPHRVMGLIYKDLENDQLAVTCYQESLRRNRRQPDVESIRTELAEVQIRLNQHAAAKEVLAECADSARVLALRAECESALGNQHVATELLNTALLQDPREPAALVLQGTLALNDGNTTLAIAAFQQIVDQIPMDFTARFKLSQALGQAGETARADEELAAMTRIKEVRREAADVYSQALRHPRDAESRFRLGVLSEKLHRRDLARMWYQAALAIDQQHLPAQTALKSLGPSGRDDELAR